MYSTLRIYFGKMQDLYLDFALEETPITDLWLERMQIRNHWPMDHADRFYGFNSVEQEINKSLTEINECISVINSYSNIVDRFLTSIDDQDTLNYLHNVFERYHGQLDQQNHKFWQHAPESVKKALANLNIAVHRCESAGRSSRPRFVCTWWGMPKEKQLPIELINQYGEERVEFGAVYLNYVEIGKTMLELAIDNDYYAADEMFKPFNFYSADFVTYFYTSTDKELKRNQQIIQEYFNQRQSFFQKFGIVDTLDYRARPLKFKVAQLQYTDKTSILDIIRNNQYIQQVELL